MSIEFTPDPALYPFESRCFDSSRGRVHYVDEGDGPPLVLYHGNPTWSFLYRNIITALRGRFRCIAADYLGFGLSDRPAGFGYTIEEHAQVMGEFIDHLGLDGYLLMAQDWVATARADRVRGVVLGNTWFWPSEDLTTRMFSRVMGSPPMQWAILRRNFFIERLIPAGTASPLSDAVMNHYRGCSQPQRPEPAWRECPRRSWRLGRCWSGWPMMCPTNWEPSPRCWCGA
jgi:haloalkane dehalogenase